MRRCGPLTAGVRCLMFCPNCAAPLETSDAESCLKCGALLGEGSAWTAVATPLEVEKASWSDAKCFAILAFPFWGTIIGLAAIGVAPKSLQEAVGGVLHLVWGVGLLFSPSPIYLSKNFGGIAKLFVVAAYCLLAVPVIYLTGWASCAFMKGCH